MDNKPSETYKRLYHEIIEDIFFQVCSNGINYCIKEQVGGNSVPIAIWLKYEEYREKALREMRGTRLDRHKIASCMCGAILEVQPLVGYNGAQILRNANEAVALYVGLNVVKFYIIQSLLGTIEDSFKQQTAKMHLRDHVEMQFPPNICDTNQYRQNLANALYRTHQKCDISRNECFRYDIWAYAEIFYHLERYNWPTIRTAYEEYMSKPINSSP